MIRKLLFGLIALLAISAKAQVVANIDWVNNYGNTTTPSLSSVASEVDASKNIYVVGTYQGSTKDLAVLKYDSTGTLLWSKTYNNGGDDYGNALAVNKVTGDVAVCGKSYGTGTTGFDYIVIKYSSSGTQTFAKRVNLANLDDEATDIKMDASGNVFVTGTGNKGGTRKKDIFSVKFTAAGTQTWTALYDGGLSDDDYGVSLVLSSNGNTVYVAGNKGTGSGVNDIVVQALKANTGGASWTYTVNGTANGDDQAYGLILAGANVVACGKLRNVSTNDDYTTIKLNGSNGDTIFKRDYDSGTNNNFATALVRDSTGNIAVVGKVFNGTYYEYHTLLYDSTGAKLWSNPNVESTLLGSANVLPKIACDTIANHFYVVGEIMRSTNDVYVYQITPTGNTTWRIYYDRGGYDAGLSLSVNGYGELYVASITTNGGSGYDITTIRISQTPVYWVPDPSGEDYSNDKLYYQNKGQLVNTSYSLVPEILYYNQMTGPEYYIQKNKMSYVMRKIDTIPANNDTLQRIDIDYVESNTRTDVYSYEPTYTKHNYFLAHLDSNGITNVNGMKRIMIPNIYMGVDLHYYSNANGIKYYYVIKPGTSPSTVKLGVTGASTSTISSGNLLLSNAIGTVNVGEVLGYQVTYTGGTYSIVNLPSAASWSTIGTNTFGFAVPSYSTNWPLVIMVSIPTTTTSTTSLQNLNYSTYRGGSGNEVFTDIFVKESDNTRYVVGQGNSQFPQQNALWTTFKGQTDVILQKYSGTDTLRFSTFYGGTGDDTPVGVKVKSDGKIYIVGNTTSLDIPIIQSHRPSADQQPLNAYYGGSTVSTQSDGFILELTNDGQTHWWSRYFGGIITDVINDVAIDKYDNLYFCGKSNSCNYPKKNSIKFGPSMCQWGTNYDWVITKMDSACKLKFSSFYGGDNIYPTVNSDAATAIDADTLGNIYVVGYNWQYTNDLSAINLTGNNSTNSIYNSTLTGPGYILMRITPAYTIDLFTELGQNNAGVQADIKVLHDQTVLMCGVTNETVGTFPLKSAAGSYNRSIGGTNTKGFLCMIDNNINNLWTTHFSQGSSIVFDKIAVSGSNSFFVSGTQQTDSVTLATTNPSGVYTKNTRQQFDGHVSYFSNINGAYNFVYSHWLGGSSYDFVNAMATYKTEALYAVGGSYSTDYPIAGPIPLITTALAGGEDGVITRFDLSVMPSIVGIKEIKSEHGLNVGFYPNPVSDQFFIDLSEVTDKQNMILTVHNTLGQLILSENLSNFNDNLLKVNSSNWGQGLYIVTLNTSNTRYSAKVIKE